MYKIVFRKTVSSNFKEALDFALELGASFDGARVVLEIPEEDILIAYSTMRGLFGYIQHWKHTKAYYNGQEVHPYQFILNAHRIGECYDKETFKASPCSLPDGSPAWGCIKIRIIAHHGRGSGVKYWYNYGYFKGSKWIIDKAKIKDILIKSSKSSGLYLCPLFEEANITKAIKSLPAFIIPDNLTFRAVFSEEIAQGQKILIPSNIALMPVKYKASQYPARIL